MKKSHYKKAIDLLFERWPYESGFDPEQDITTLCIAPAEGEEGDTNTYAYMECHCNPSDCRYNKPKVITVTFNLSNK